MKKLLYIISHLFYEQYWRIAKAVLYMEDRDIIEDCIKSGIGLSAFSEGVPFPSSSKGTIRFHFEHGVRDLIICSSGGEMSHSFYPFLKTSVGTIMIEGRLGIIDHAFDGFTNNRYIIVQDCPSFIGEYCFANQQMLEEADLLQAEGMDELPTGCFSGDSSLVQLYLPSTIRRICDNALAGCISLSTVYTTMSKQEWETVAIGSGNDILRHAIVASLTSE